MWAGLAAVVLVVVLAGCQVTTAVTVQAQPDGTGSVTVTIRADQAAVRAVGGVEGQLRDSDLAAAGWQISTAPGGAGSTVVTLVHGFSRLSAVPGILAEVGQAPTGAHTPLFVLHLSQTRAFFETTMTAVGSIDLSCGLSCFGDAALQRAYGSELGLDPTGLEGPGGTVAAERDFQFSFRLEVPGRVNSSDAASPASGLRWVPVLGRRTPVSATTTALDVTHVTEASAAGGVTVIGLFAGIVALIVGVRRARRRPRAAGDGTTGRT